jgi:hypothetical protein
MVNWTRDEHLTFDIAFALKKVTVPGFRKALKEEDRFAIANTIREHLKLCRWEFSKHPSHGLLLCAPPGGPDHCAALPPSVVRFHLTLGQGRGPSSAALIISSSNSGVGSSSAATNSRSFFKPHLASLLTSNLMCILICAPLKGHLKKSGAPG